MKLRSAIFAIGLLGVLLVGFIANQIRQSTPKVAFERLVIRPVPKSVGDIEHRSHNTLDSNFQLLRFRISKPDVQNLIATQRFVTIDENDEFRQWDKNLGTFVKIQKTDYLKKWEKQIAYTVGLDVTFTTNWQVYCLKEGNGQKHLFVDPDNLKVVLVAAAH